MSAWTHLHLEAFCGYASISKKSWKTIEMKQDKKGNLLFDKDGNFKRGKEHICENPNYISRTKRPEWCKKENKERLPRFRCLADKCPFFAYDDCEPEEYIAFDKTWEKLPKE